MEKIGRNELKNRVLEIIMADYTILDERKNEDGCWIFHLKDENNNLVLTTYIKNVSSAYLSYDINVDRIQIPAIPSIHKTTKDKCFLLIGYKKIDEDNGVLVCWDPQRYVTHAKYRSAYIYHKNIAIGIDKGFYTTVDHDNKVFICRKGFFKNVIDSYIKDSYFEDFEW